MASCISMFTNFDRGADLPVFAVENKIDVVLAADCVYLEAAFPLLEKTLLDLTDVKNPPVILMSYKKRRKADARFFKAMRKHFKFHEVSSRTTSIPKHYLLTLNRSQITPITTSLSKIQYFCIALLVHS